MIEISGIEAVRNEDYNFLRKRMLRLEESYKQSNDQRVRQVLKEKTLFEICERFPNFYEEYSNSFESCKMSSLMEITNLTDFVMSKYSVEKLSPITENEAKKILKLKDKTLKIFVKGYNDAIVSKDLTYYSQRIDDKLVCLTKQDNEFIGSVTNVTPNIRNRECLCYFCRQFRRGDDILFITNTAKTSKGEYSSIGQTVCSDYEMCNKDIESSAALVKFLRYKLDKEKDK